MLKVFKGNNKTITIVSTDMLLVSLLLTLKTTSTLIIYF